MRGERRVWDAGGKSPFPREWGRPVGEQFSEERAAWVRGRVREHMAGASLRSSSRMKLPQAVSIYLDRIKDGP